MSNEVARWFSGTSAVTRQHDRALTAVDHATELGEAWIDGINRVTQRAMFETMRTQMLQQQAERIAPDGSELYAMIAVAGAVQSARVIEGLNRRCGR